MNEGQENFKMKKNRMNTETSIQETVAFDVWDSIQESINDFVWKCIDGSVEDLAGVTVMHDISYSSFRNPVRLVVREKLE